MMLGLELLDNGCFRCLTLDENDFVVLQTPDGNRQIIAKDQLLAVLSVRAHHDPFPDSLPILVPLPDPVPVPIPEPEISAPAVPEKEKDSIPTRQKVIKEVRDQIDLTGVINASKIGRALGVSPATVSYHLERLEKEILAYKADHEDQKYKMQLNQNTKVPDDQQHLEVVE